MSNIEVVNAGHVTTNPNASEPIAKAVDTSSASKAENTEEKKDNSFTYDEGQGVKETVMLTGPLSEVYTRVLTHCFAKKELTGTDDQEVPTPSEPVIATESQQLEEQALQMVLAQSTGGLNDPVGNKFDFADELHEPENVTTKAYLVTPGAALMPEVVENVQNVAQNTDKKVIMVITASPKGETMGVDITKRFVQIGGDVGKNSLYNDEEQFNVAAESLYKPFGVTVVHGIGGLVNHLRSLV